MGIELRPVFQPRLAGVTWRAEGKALIDDLDALEDLALDRGITPLSAFIDSADEDFDADADLDAGDDAAADGEWFAADEGLRAVRNLLALLEDPDAQDALSDSETVANDLEELARCLEIAASQNARFRLSVC